MNLCAKESLFTLAVELLYEYSVIQYSQADTEILGNWGTSHFSPGCFIKLIVSLLP